MVSNPDPVGDNESRKKQAMKTTGQLKRLSFWLAVFGFTTAVFFFGLNFGLGIGWEITFKNDIISGTPPNVFDYMGGNCLIIAVCLLIFVAFQLMRDKVFLKSTALIPLILMLMQCRILIAFTPQSLPDWVTEYAGWLEIVLYAGFLFLALAIALLTLQLYLIWSIYHSSIYKSP